MLAAAVLLVLVVDDVEDDGKYEFKSIIYKAFPDSGTSRELVKYPLLLTAVELPVILSVVLKSAFAFSIFPVIKPAWFTLPD